MSSKTPYYVFHDGGIYPRQIIGWKAAYRAAKRIHSTAFIMEVRHYERVYGAKSTSWMKKKFNLSVWRRK